MVRTDASTPNPQALPAVLTAALLLVRALGAAVMHGRQAALKKIAAIEDEMHLHREKAVADAEFYRVRVRTTCPPHRSRLAWMHGVAHHRARWSPSCAHYVCAVVVWRPCAPSLTRTRVPLGPSCPVCMCLWQATKEAEANSELLTESYLELQQIMAMGNTSKVYFGPQLPSFVLAGTNSGRGQ